jgi:glycosyltransferase 2 family protein
MTAHDEEKPTPATRTHVWPRVAVSLVLAGGFAWMLRRGGLPIVPSSELLARIGPTAILAYALWFSLLWLVRVHRWAYLLRPLATIPKREVMAAGLIGAAAIVLAPLRLGELARPYLIAGRGVTFTQAAGAVGAERVADGFVLASFLMVGLLTSTPLSPLPNHLGELPMPVSAVPRAAWTSLLIFACAFAAMAAFYFQRARATRLVETIVGVVSPKAATLLAGAVAKVADGLSFLPNRRDSLPFARDSLIYWAMNAAGFLLVMRAAGFDATLAHAMVMMGVLSLGIMVPSGPGFFGAFQLSAYCGLAMFFPLDRVVAEGSAVVFVLYVVQTLVAVTFGVVGLVLLPSRTTAIAATNEDSL